MADDVSVQFGADTRNAEEGSRRVADSVEGLKQHVESMSEGFKKLGEIIGVSLTIEGIKNFIEGFAELGTQLVNTSAMLGVTVEQVTELKFIAEATGGSLESMSLGMERLAFNMERAGAGSKTEQAAFKELGVSATDSSGHLKSLDEMMNEVADAFAAHADGAEKTALAIQLFGRAGAGMIPVLDEGRAGLQRFRDASKATGDDLAVGAKGMEETHVKLVTLGTTITNLGASLFNFFKPIIDSVVDTFTKWIGGIRDAIDKNETMRTAMKVLAETFTLLEVGIDFAIFGLQSLYEIGKSTFLTLAEGFIATAATINDAVHLNWGAIGGEWKAAGDAIASQWADSMKTLIAASDETKKTIAAQFAAVDAVIANTDQKLHITVHPGDAKPSFVPPGAPDPGVLKAWDSLFTSIVSGFDKAATGLIRGTMTWKQATIEVLGSIWQEFVKLVEKMIVQWLSAEAMKLAATQAGVAARTTAEGIGAAAQSALLGNQIIKDILNSAQQVFAGIFGFLSPLMGPFASGPAAAGAATVAATAGAVSLDVGSWSLPSDMLAKVHKDEMILPATFAQGMRDQMAGGGGSGGGMGDHDLDRLVAKLVPHLRASANASRAMQRNVDSRLRMLRGAT